MAPTLPPGSLLLTRRLRPSDDVRRGDIVILRSAELGRRIVKRVVGLPGELVRVNSTGISINGFRLPEPYAGVNDSAAHTFSVPDDAYVVLGDNRGESCDSRSWRQPYVPRSAIQGRRLRWTRLSSMLHVARPKDRR